jgi:hypothetical protein
VKPEPCAIQPRPQHQLRRATASAAGEAHDEERAGQRGSRATPDKLSRTLLAALSPLVVSNDTGHLVLWEQSQRVGSDLIDFVMSLSA